MHSFSVWLFAMNRAPIIGRDLSLASGLLRLIVETSKEWSVPGGWARIPRADTIRNIAVANGRIVRPELRYNTSVTHALDYLTEQLDGWRKAGTYQHLRELQSACEPIAKFDGREVINLASNNYLGL